MYTPNNVAGWQMLQHRAVPTRHRSQGARDSLEQPPLEGAERGRAQRRPCVLFPLSKRRDKPNQHRRARHAQRRRVGVDPKRHAHPAANPQPPHESQPAVSAAGRVYQRALGRRDRNPVCHGALRRGLCHHAAGAVPGLVPPPRAVPTGPTKHSTSCATRFVHHAYPQPLLRAWTSAIRREDSFLGSYLSPATFRRARHRVFRPAPVHRGVRPCQPLQCAHAHVATGRGRGRPRHRDPAATSLAAPVSHAAGRVWRCTPSGWGCQPQPASRHPPRL